MAAYVTANRGGTINLKSKTYIVGQQLFAGAAGKGYAYQAKPILAISNCAAPVTINGNGAVLRAAPGLKFGAFHPVTGLRYDGAGTQADYIGNAYKMIDLSNNAGGVSVSNLELDGNLTAYVLGGMWGDTGRQLSANGIVAYGNASLSLSNINSHHHGTDGYTVGYAGLTQASPACPVSMVDCLGQYNGRQGLSFVGGIGLTVLRCKFNHTGRIANTLTGEVISSNPCAGVDLEAEASVGRNALFEDCQFINNFGPGMVSDGTDVADVTFRRCTFWGVTNYAIWPKAKRFAFEDCNIFGATVAVYGGAVRVAGTQNADGTHFLRCNFEDRAWENGLVFMVNSLLIESELAGVGFSDCTATLYRANLAMNNALINQFLVTSRVGTLPNKALVCQLGGATATGLYIDDQAAHTTPDGYYVDTIAAPSTLVNCLISSPANKIGWGAVVSQGGHTGFGP